MKVSNPDKELFAGVSKQEVVDHYLRVADRMLAWVADRPLSLRRFPDGVSQEGFFQKDTPEWVPDFVSRVVVEKSSGESVRYASCSSAECLAYLANLAVIEFHPWLSRAPDVDFPDMLVFDLDPPPSRDFSVVRAAASDLRLLLEELGMRCFLKVSGSKGVHVVVPLVGDADFSVAKEVSRAVASLLCERFPEQYTVSQRKVNREGRVFIDYLRNEHGQTAIAPYSLRALDGAPVALPVAWEDLGSVVGDSFRIGGDWLGADPWAGFWDERFSLAGLREELLG